MRATTLDLRAVGWVITRDAFVEVMRVKLGGGRGVDARVLRAVAAQWRALQACEARADASPAAPRLSLVARPLSADASERLAAILRDLAAHWPAQYGLAVLRRRTVLAALQSAIGFALGLVLAGPLSSDSAMLAGVALVMIAMGLWSLAVATQLLRTRHVAEDALRIPAGDESAAVQPRAVMAADASAAANEESDAAHWRGDRRHERQ